MGLHFVVAAQWQGSGSTRALHLSDGAAAIRGDLPSAKTSTIDIPLGAGEDLGTGVRRFSSLQLVRDRLAEALAEQADTVVTIGGDCGVELAPIAHAYAQHPGELALVWLDAHADANSPETSASGAFHGMVLRTLCGQGPEALVPDDPIPTSNVILAGTRSFDEPEAEWMAEHGIRVVPPDELNAESLLAAIRATGAKAVYLHVDLDVLDPAEFGALDFPEPFGITLATLVEAIRGIVAEFTLAGAGLCEFAPSTPDAATDDLPAILRIIGALSPR